MSQAQLQEAFRTALDLPADTDWPTLAYGGHEQWDSLGHMALVAEIEERFDVMLDTDDVIDMSSYPVTVDILRERYGVEL